MGKFKLEIEELAETHLRRHFKSGDKIAIKKIEQIFKELAEHPSQVPENPKL